jgi:glycogen debranching enzyme
MQFDREEWLKEARTLLTSNVVSVDGHRYTRPAPSIYEHQWLWDSCFHAIVWRWLDPQMAWDELRALAATQVQTGSDAGMVPHMAYWRGGGEVIWKNPSHSIITQPPLMAVAAEQVLHTTGDAASARGSLDALSNLIARRRVWSLPDFNCRNVHHIITIAQDLTALALLTASPMASTRLSSLPARPK